MSFIMGIKHHLQCVAFYQFLGRFIAIVVYVVILSIIFGLIAENENDGVQDNQRDIYSSAKVNLSKGQLAANRGKFEGNRKSTYPDNSMTMADDLADEVPSHKTKLVPNGNEQLFSDVGDIDNIQNNNIKRNVRVSDSKIYGTRELESISIE